MEEKSKNLLGASPAGKWLFQILGIAFAICIGATCLNSIPGMLEASNRSKVSRARTEMRSLATAIEAYCLDNKSYPASLAALTSPVAYAMEIPADPYAPQRHSTYKYFAAKQRDHDGWMLLSAGPDRDYDVDPTRMLDVSTTGPSPALLHCTFDPTNGTVSDGDIWRLRQ